MKKMNQGGHDPLCQMLLIDKMRAVNYIVEVSDVAFPADLDMGSVVSYWG